jgi:GH18 family chitinase
MKTKVIFILILQSILGYAAIAQFKVIGYLATWSNNYPTNVNSLQLSKLTHINIAFANPTTTAGTPVPADGTNADVTTVVNAAHAQGVKVFMSMGGAGAPGTIYKNSLKAANVNTFITNIVNYAVTYNLDGIDVDIEGDVLDGTTVTAAQYQTFVTGLATALHAQGKQMSAALAQWFGNYVTNTAAAQFDWINMMSYDSAIPGSGDPVGQHSPYSQVTDDYSYWNTTKGVPSTKLVVGIPFYGYGWGTRAVSGNDEIAYCDIVTANAGAENTDQVGTNPNVIYYNGIPTIKQKTTYALANASGVMIWQITEDCNNSKSLLSAINSTIHPLPVTLIEFEVASQNQENYLSWSTSSEEKNDYINVERSSDGIHYDVIGSLKGYNTTNTIENYSFLDQHPSEGTNYYRLAQYDFDGTVKYSKVIVLNKNEHLDYTIYPNPFEYETLIRTDLSATARVIQVTTIQGSLLLNYSLAAGTNQLLIGEALEPGIYFVKIQDNNASFVQKIIKR